MPEPTDKRERYRQAVVALKSHLDANKAESGPEYEKLLDEVNAAHAALVKEEDE